MEVSTKLYSKAVLSPAIYRSFYEFCSKGITNPKKLEYVEYAIRAVILNDIVELQLYPKAENHHQISTVFSSTNELDTIAKNDPLYNEHKRDWNESIGYLIKSAVETPNKIDKYHPKLGTPEQSWDREELYYALAIINQGGTAYINETWVEENKVLLKQNPMSNFFIEFDNEWNNNMSKLNNYTPQIQFPPFLSIVLSQANSRAEIPTVMADLKVSYEKDRKIFWGLIKDICNQENLKQSVNAARELENASKNLFTASFTERINPLRVFWSGVTQTSLLRGLGAVGEKLLDFDEPNSMVTRVDLARRIKKDLREIEGMKKLLTKHKIRIKT